MTTQHELELSLLDSRLAKLTEMGDPLVKLNLLINWENFRPELNRIRQKERKSNAGARPFDLVLMFKILILQNYYGLSDHDLEYQIRDRFSFTRFLGLTLLDRIPDEKTIWLFRETLGKLGLVEVLFAKFHEQLAEHGYQARGGQMVDATFVEAPKQRNSREENALIKEGKSPEEWDKTPNKKRQKDVDARWVKKNKETHYGYKNHINADQKNKLIQSYAVTDAAVHDSQVFEELLDQTEDADGNKRPVYADSAYRSADKEAQLAKDHIESQICEKGVKNHPLTDEQKLSNREKSKVRSRVEHVFGAQAAMNADIVRTIGIKRAKVRIGLTNLVYNMIRFGQLLKRDGLRIVVCNQKKDSCGEGVPEMA
jgi:transposase, IS5 family